MVILAPAFRYHYLLLQDTKIAILMKNGNLGKRISLLFVMCRISCPELYSRNILQSSTSEAAFQKMSNRVEENADIHRSPLRKVEKQRFSSRTNNLLLHEHRDIHRNPIMIVINHSFIEIILQIYDPFYLKLTLFYQPPFLHICISTIVREAFKTVSETIEILASIV